MGRTRLPDHDEACVIIMQRLRQLPGLLTRIAAELHVTPQAVYAWEVVPLHHVVVVEHLTGIPRHELRPDYHLPPVDLPKAAGA